MRGASVELGAGWVPELLRRLDWVVKHLEPHRRQPAGLSAHARREQITQQLAFTPFVFEAVGDLIDQSNADLYLFSTDYPHIEGGRNPIGRFEAALGERSEAVRDKFYAENFLRIFPNARAPAPAAAAVPSARLTDLRGAHCGGRAGLSLSGARRVVRRGKPAWLKAY